MEPLQPDPHQHTEEIRHLQPRSRSKGRILVEMYGLKQAGKLAQARLTKHLATHGYHNSTEAPCIFRHITRNIAFTLVVDDFGVKYQSTEDPEHLLRVLRELYTVTVDWEGKKYEGLTIKQVRERKTRNAALPHQRQDTYRRPPRDLASTSTTSYTHTLHSHTSPHDKTKDHR